MRFNSITGRAALAARGGYALHRKYGRNPPWLARARALAAIARTRQRIKREVQCLDALCRRVTGLPLSAVAQLWEAGRLESFLAELTRREKEDRQRRSTATRPGRWPIRGATFHSR